MANSKIDVTKVVPAGDFRFHVSSQEELKSLGQSNLKVIKQRWRNTEHMMKFLITRDQERLDLFEGGTADKISKLAENYEMPEFPHITTTDSIWGDPQPTDPDSLTRAKNATTFNCCGWCKYHDPITGYHNCAITAHCDLVPYELRNSAKPYAFNTPCIFKGAPEPLVKASIAFLEGQKELALERKRDAARYISYLNRISKNMEDKPLLPQFRPADHFKLKERVVCYLDYFEGILPEKVGQIVHGTVIYGYRYEDGCVSVYTDEPCHTGRNHDGHGLSFSNERPDIMHEEEYDYLLAHPDYRELWLRLIDEYWNNHYVIPTTSLKMAMDRAEKTMQ